MSDGSQMSVDTGNQDQKHAIVARIDVLEGEQASEGNVTEPTGRPTETKNVLDMANHLHGLLRKPPAAKSRTGFKKGFPKPKAKAKSAPTSAPKGLAKKRPKPTGSDVLPLPSANAGGPWYCKGCSIYKLKASGTGFRVKPPDSTRYTKLFSVGDRCPFKSLNAAWKAVMDFCFAPTPSPY